jgi:hypothetical protein
VERVQNPGAEAFEVGDVAGDDHEVVNQRGRGYRAVLVNRIRPSLHEAGVSSEGGGGDDGERVGLSAQTSISRALAGSRARHLYAALDFPEHHGANSVERSRSPNHTRPFPFMARLELRESPSSGAKQGITNVFPENIFQTP